MGKKTAAISLALACAFACLSVPVEASAADKAQRTAPWNSETSDLEADKRIIYGVLPNGLRYAIRHNERPENQVLIRLAVEFGSAAEADNEQGLAHFIEHMAFNGTTNVPEGEMVRKLERLGLSFGADTNASTGYLRTQYKLDLPKSDPQLIDQALFLLRETASEVLFNPEAVERERGVVIAEMRDRENYNFQRARAVNQLFYPGSYFSTRYPIGTLDVLQNAPAERMRALYRRWYTPDRTRLIIVGPVDPVAMEKAILRHFASWRGEGRQLSDLDRCSFDTQRPSGAGVFSHPEVSEAISVEQILPDRPRPDTFERALLDLRMQIAAGIIGDRIARKSRREDVPLLGSNIGFSAGFCDQHARIGFAIGSKDGGWRKALPIVEQMVRQAVEHGFGEQEIAEQIQRLDAAFANAVRSESTTTSGAFANELTNLDDDIVTAADYRQRLWLQLRPFMGADSVSREFAYWFNKLERPQIFLSGRKIDGVTEADIVSAFTASRNSAVTPPDLRVAKGWAYSDFGTAGVLVSDTRISDLDIRTLRFANGVRLNLKKTDFEKDRVRWSLRVDGGRMHFAQKDQPLAMFMQGAYVGGGLGAYDADDLRAALAGTTAAPILAVGADHFGGSSAVVRKDLERQLQLLAAMITDPGYRGDAVRLFRRPLAEFYSRLNATPSSALTQGQARVMNGDDLRFVLPPREQLEAADFAALRAALGDVLATAPIEIGLVGDFDEAEAIAMVARTFGALPMRKAEAVIDPAASATRYSGAFGIHILPHRGEANQMAWRRVWPTTDDSDQRLEQTMGLLADIVRIRLLDELREKLGATYGAGASSDMSDIYTGRGTFSVGTNGDPKDIDAIEKAVEAVIAEITAAPVDADLFERGRKPSLESYADWRRQNSTWMQIVDQAQTEPERLERFRRNEERFRSITAQDVWEAAKRFLADKPSYIFRAMPEAKATAPAG